VILAFYRRLIDFSAQNLPNDKLTAFLIWLKLFIIKGGNMPTVKQQICIFIMSLLIGFHQAWATTYYVSPNGNNANTGQTLSSPFKTIQAALNVAGNNGDTIYVLSGVYVETVSIRQNNLTLTAYPNNKPVIDGKTTLPNTDWDALMMVDGNYATAISTERI
jgi:pectin methylesterase-like acyl-CoA thioesterase